MADDKKVEPACVLADGVAAAQVTLQLLNSTGGPLAGRVVQIAVSGSANSVVAHPCQRCRVPCLPLSARRWQRPRVRDRRRTGEPHQREW